MSSKEKIMAAKDIRLLLKENTFLIIISIFIIMSILSTYIGWSSQNILRQVYDAASKEIIQEGKPVPPFPLSQNSPLYVMKNMIIYIVLIGALLSIIIGHIVSINDRRAGTSRILFSKPFSKKQFLSGKILAASKILFFVLFLSMIISVISVALLSSISLDTFFAICIFYASSFLYLAGFAYFGIFFGIKTNNSTQAILLPLILWIIIIFVLPEFGSALYPTSSLNPVLPNVNLLDSPTLKTIHSIVYPFSISEQYKEFEASSMGIKSDITETNIQSYSQGIHLLILFAWFFISLALSYYAAETFNAAEGDSYE